MIRQNILIFLAMWLVGTVDTSKVEQPESNALLLTPYKTLSPEQLGNTACYKLKAKALIRLLVTDYGFTLLPIERMLINLTMIHEATTDFKIPKIEILHLSAICRCGITPDRFTIPGRSTGRIVKVNCHGFITGTGYKYNLTFPGQCYLASQRLETSPELTPVMIQTKNVDDPYVLADRFEIGNITFFDVCTKDSEIW